MNKRYVVSWVLIVPVALLFLLTAASKLTGAAAQQFIGWGYAAWFAYVIGALEGIGAVALLVPKSMRWGVYLLSVIMVGAAITHLVNAEWLGLLRPAIFAGFMWGALYARQASRAVPGGNDGGGRSGPASAPFGTGRR